MSPRLWPQTLIVASDVEASSRFYCDVLGLESGHGGPEYEQLLHEGEIVLQLHDDKPDDAHNALGDLRQPVANGVVLWFEVVDFDAAVDRARTVGATIEREVFTNPNAKQRELWIRDPDGYLVVVASPSEYRPR